MHDKIAISASRALGALHARMGQGARVAPQVLEQAGQTAGAATTPANLRRLVLGAGDDARAAQSSAAFSSHPIPAARRNAAEQVTALEQSHPEQMYQLGRERAEILEGLPWSSNTKKDMLFGGGSTLADPTGLIAPSAKATAPTQIAPTLAARRIPAANPAEGGTVAVRKPRPKTASSAGDRITDGTWARPELFGMSTGIPGRTQQIQADPKAQISSAFDQQAKQLADMTPTEPKFAAHKLYARVKFRGLPISIETPKGGFRHWYDPHADKHGKTKMKYAYGYIRRTKGLDGDHVDVFVGPNEKATHVYVVMTKKAPDFKEFDEEKCMLGFDSEEAAKAAFSAHYDKPGFFHSITSLTFDAFEKRVFETFDGTRKKVAWDPGTSFRRDQEPPIPKYNGGPVADLQSVLGVQEKSLGFPAVGAQRIIMNEPMDTEDRIDRQFRYHDLDQHSTAIENTDLSGPANPSL